MVVASTPLVAMGLDQEPEAEAAAPAGGVIAGGVPTSRRAPIQLSGSPAPALLELSIRRT